MKADESISRHPFRLLEEAVQKQPHKLALTSPSTSLTFTELFDATKAFVRYFRSHGLVPGDRIALRLRAELSIPALLAASHEGIVSVSYNQGFRDYSTLGCKFLVSDCENMGLELLPTKVITPELLMDLGKEKAKLEFRGFTSDHALAKVVFTSGTTGTPKAIGLSLAQLTQRAKNLIQVLRPESKHLSTIGSDILPGYNTLMMSLWQAQTYYIPTNAIGNLALIENQQISTLLASPIQLAELVSIAKPEQLSSLTRIQLTGSLISREQFEKTTKVTRAKLESQFGSAETGAVALTELSSASLNRIERIFPWAQIEVVGEAHQTVLPEIVGSIRIRSQAAVHGYLISSMSDNQQFREGFFYPGDLGQLESDGAISLVGRSNEVINIGGVKVSPTEIEDYIGSKFGFAEVAAFPFQDRDGNQRLGLALVSLTAPDLMALQQAIQSRFASGRPSLVMRLPQLPRNEMGKVLRVQLAELARRAEKPAK